MIHGHLEYMPLKANPKRSEEYARQHIRYCNAQIRHCRKQLRYYRRLRFKKQLDKKAVGQASPAACAAFHGGGV